MSGVPLVVSAPSGAGKSTLVKMLLAEFPSFHFSISCATREKRPGEADGKDYYFISEAEFEKKRANNEFLEWARVHGHFYGTPAAPARAALARGENALFDVDVAGAAQIRVALPETKFVFIVPPNLAELENRLRGRGHNDEADIKRRLKNALGEMRQAFWYDAIVLNDRLEDAYAALRAVFIAATLAPARNRVILNNLLAGGA